MITPSEENYGEVRRSVLRAIVTVVASVPLLALTSVTSKAAKVSKAAVAYRDSPNGSERCDNCRLFEPPHACAQVAGTISPNGWCRIWVGK